MGSDGEWVGGDAPSEGQPKRDTGRTSPDSGAGLKQGAGMQLGAHFPLVSTQLRSISFQTDNLLGPVYVSFILKEGNTLFFLQSKKKKKNPCMTMGSDSNSLHSAQVLMEKLISGVFLVSLRG